MAKGTYDTVIARDLPLDALKKMFAASGCTKVFAKELAPNDNSKNQIYLGGSFDALAQIPVGEWTRVNSKSKKNGITKSSVLLQNQIPFSWITPEGARCPAKRAKLIYYPQFPEVRFSGFLMGSAVDASRWMTPDKEGRSEGRFLIWGINPGRGSFGYLAVPGTCAARELKHALAGTSGERCGVLCSLEVSTAEADKQALLDRLAEIMSTNPHFGRKLDTAQGCTIPYSASNAGGITLEALFGISPNGLAEPDFRGWELKGHSQSVITLLTPQPDGGLYVEQGVIDFVERYGYPDKKGRANRLNFGGSHKIDQTHKNTGLTLSLEGVSFKGNSTTFQPEGYLGLLDSAGGIAASWSFEKLLNHWTTKHANTAFVPFKKMKEATPNCFTYHSPVHLGEGTSFAKFLDSVGVGSIYYDPGIKLELINGRKKTKHRNQFRITEKNLGGLYEHFSEVFVSIA